MISLLDGIFDRQLFQIDANMGGAAYICEALMQSRRDHLYLLPALPTVWQTGSVKNFRAQDGITVSFQWQDGKLRSFTLLSRDDRSICVHSQEQIWQLALKANEPKTVMI